MRVECGYLINIFLLNQKIIVKIVKIVQFIIFTLWWSFWASVTTFSTRWFGHWQTSFGFKKVSWTTVFSDTFEVGILASGCRTSVTRNQFIPLFMSGPSTLFPKAFKTNTFKYKQNSCITFLNDYQIKPFESTY